MDGMDHASDCDDNAGGSATAAATGSGAAESGMDYALDRDNNAGGPAEDPPPWVWGRERWRETSFHAGVFFCEGSDTVGNIRPETETEQSILEISSRTRPSKRQQHLSSSQGGRRPGRSLQVFPSTHRPGTAR